MIKNGENKEVLYLEGSVPYLALRTQNENLVMYTNAHWKCMGGQCSGKLGNGTCAMTERRQLLERISPPVWLEQHGLVLQRAGDNISTLQYLNTNPSLICNEMKTPKRALTQ